ncbi:DUF1156 domain-containing protein [Micromonospora humida]|uniref:DUF1156 domain-containing protein n=1 Tax=Micromonospora humida TaxID=2809018 RepID=UPI0034284CFC
MKRKLIEVALPLETINRESAREKSIRHGHPSTLHLWWARRPLAAARAVLFAQLVDDPSSRPDEFPTEEAQRVERGRLHKIIERLVAWENVRNERLLAEARAEIIKSCDGNPPQILDPFAGGGTIPLEAQRLGLDAHASDLNPVAVLINKALIEIPPKFRNQPPVFPGRAESELRAWKGAEGLAADVRAYGGWMRAEAEKRIGHLYPKAKLPDGSEATVVAWIWARTVTCPNPGCRIELPLARTWWLGKKKGKEAYVVPSLVSDPAHPSGLRVDFDIASGKTGAPPASNDGTIARGNAKCLACDAAVPNQYIREQATSIGLGARMIAIVAERNRQRIYLAPTAEHEETAQVSRPLGAPDQPVPFPNHDVDRLPMYGMLRWSDAFTNRQLVALVTLGDLVSEVRRVIERDASQAGLPDGERLESGGVGAQAYADAVCTYLGLSASKSAVFHCSLARWRADADKTAPAFGRQAIAMVWDFAETMPFAGAGGDWSGVVDGAARVLESLPADASGDVRQIPAQKVQFTPARVISTDPPYYDNIGYSDLSDYFYVWLRRCLRQEWPNLLSTVLVPKAEELVANSYRQGGLAAARDFFERGFQRVFAQSRAASNTDFPATVYYAFKQSDSSEEGTTSSGWETLLDGMISGGWCITATWPMRTEGETRLISRNTNALASSIVLSLRPRPGDAATTDRRGLIATLQTELPDALRKLQQGAIAPVDLPQAAIGPGMAVFSRYAKVLEPDGSQMTVRSALARINEILDQVLSEQEGDFDSATRFAIAWYRQHGYTTGAFGDADNLARARNTSVERMDRDEILTSRAGKVTLIKPADTPGDYDVNADAHTSTWEVLHHTIRILEAQGVPAAGAFLATAQGRPDGAVDLDLVKELAFLLFSIAEKNGWVRDAISFNAVAQSWGDVVDASKSTPASHQQGEFEFLAEDD